MPISAAGRADAVSRDAAGFTLVELLVVLTIIALVSAAVVLAVPDPRGNLGSEAERFAARARAAGERAIMDNRPISLRVSQTGYAFQRRQGKDWQGMSEKPFLPQRWGDGVRVQVAAAGDRTVFDTTGLADPLHVTLARGREQASVDIAAGGTIRVSR